MRKPSLKKKIAARTSVKRYVRHNLGFKAPRGIGWLTNPKKAAYNRVYYRKNKAEALILGALISLIFFAVWLLFRLTFEIAKAVFLGLRYLVREVSKKSEAANPISSSAREPGKIYAIHEAPQNHPRLISGIKRKILI